MRIRKGKTSEETTVRLIKSAQAKQNAIGKVLDDAEGAEKRTHNELQNALKAYAIDRVQNSALKLWFLKSAAQNAEEIAYHAHWNDVLWQPRIDAAGSSKTDKGRRLNTQRRSYYGRSRMYAAIYALNTKSIRSTMTPAQIKDANNVIAIYEDTKAKARREGKKKTFTQKYDDMLKKLHALLDENAKGRAEYITAKKTIARLCEARSIDLD